jgi:hypothetical protein
VSRFEFVMIDPMLPHHPKTLELAGRLGIQPFEVWSRLISLWIYAFKLAKDGDITSVAKSGYALANIINLDAEKALQFIGEATKEGSNFVDIVDNKYILHDWNTDGSGRMFVELEAKKKYWRAAKLKEKENKEFKKNPKESKRIQKILEDSTTKIEIEIKKEIDIKKELTPPTPLDGLSTETVASKAASEGELSEKVFAKPKDVQEAWNEICSHLPKCSALTQKRLGNIHAAKMTINEWRGLFERMAENPFFAGDNDRGWKADIEFALAPGRRIKVLEGSFDFAKKTKSRDGIKADKPNIPTEF